MEDYILISSPILWHQLFWYQRRGPVTVKVQLSLCTAWRHIGGIEVQLHSCLTWALYGGWRWT